MGDREPRKKVQLTGTALLEDGTPINLAIVDLSYDGCKVQTPIGLTPGVTLGLSIVGLSSELRSTVRWSTASNAGLQFNHQSEEHSRPEHPPRQQERLQLAGQVKVRRPGREHYALRMFDLAPTGCRVEFVERPQVGETVWAKFEGLEAIEAVVRWMDGFYGGVEFVRPIHEGVFSILLRKLQG